MRLLTDRSTERRLSIVIAVTVALLLGAAMTAQASHDGGTIVVDDDGDDDFTSIQAAIDHADPGDTIAVEPGTYEETLTVDKEVTLLGAKAGLDGRERSLVEQDESSVKSPGGISVTIEDGADVTFDGFRFEDASRFLKTAGSSYDVTLENSVFAADDFIHSPFRIRHPGDLTFHRNRVTVTGPTNGMWVSPGSPGAVEVEITDNLWHGNVAWMINANGITGTIAGNEINGTGADQWSILLADGIRDLTVEDNLFRANLGGISLWHTFDGSLDIVGNAFRANEVAAIRALEESETETGDPKADVSDVTVRFNSFRGDKVQVQHQGEGDLDARLNDWGVYDEAAVGARAFSVDEDEILQTPFLLADGSPEPGLPENARTGQRYMSIQTAVSDAAPGDRIVVPASADAATPTPYPESVSVETEDVTVCGAVRGAPICSSDYDGGRWQLSHSQWADAPGNGYGEGMLLEDPDQSGRRGSTSLFPPAGTQVSDIQALSVDFWIKDGDCGAGSPRIGLNIDEDADGDGDGKAYVYNETLQQGGCPEGEWIQANFDNPDDTFWRWNGQKYDTIDELAAAAPHGHEIFAANLEWDNGALAVIDNQQVNGWVLGERQDIACGWTADEICRGATARQRTVIDADGLQGGPVDLAADGTGATDLTLTDADGDTGVHVAADLAGATIADNVVRHGPIADADVTANGLHVDRRTRDVTVADNTIRGWKNAIKVGRGSAPTIDGNRILANVLKGIQVRCGDTSPTMRDNAFESNPIAVNVCGDGVTMRGNAIDGTNDLALVTTPASSGITVDARLDDWGVLGEEAIRTGRINDQGEDNTILVKPYLDSAGNAHPPLPAVWCFSDDDGDGFAELNQVDTALGLQEAEDLSLPDRCVDRDGDGRTHRTIVLGDDVEAYDGATVDTEVLIQTALGATESQRSAQFATDDLPGGARIEATADQPALEFVAGAEGDGPNPEVLDVTVEAPSTGIEVGADDVTLERVLVEGTGGPGVLVDGASGATVRDSLLDLQAGADAVTGIQLTGTVGSLVESNTIHGTAYPGSLGVNAETADGTTVSGNVIVGSYSGVRLAESTGGTIEDNVVVAPRNVVTTDSLGVSLHRGSGHVLSDNLVQGAGVGLNVGGAGDVTATGGQYPDTGTAVRLRTAGTADQPTGFEIHRAKLFGEEAALVLGDDTVALSVDAECNDWAAYHATTIEGERIDDRGAANDVDYQPFIQPGAQDAASECLVPPRADFTPRDVTISPGEEVAFTDLSEEGSKPIVRWSWSFGDGTNDTQFAPDGSTRHTYSTRGEFPVVLRVTDIDGMTSTAVGRVRVVDKAPTLEPIPDATVTEGETLRIDAVADDPEGEVLNLSASNLPPGASFRQRDDAIGRFEWTPALDQAGVYEGIVVTATDGTTTVQEMFTVTVEDTATSRIAEILPPLTRDLSPDQLNPGQTLRFQGRAGDAEVEITSVVFHPDGHDSPRIEASRDTDDLRGEVWETAPFAYETIGTKTVVMTVTDETGRTQNLTDQVEVTANRGPVARFAQETVVVDGVRPSVPLDAGPSIDPDGRPVTFLWELPGDDLRASPTPVWSIPSITWTADRAGTFSANLTVRDHALATDRGQVRVRVDDAVGISSEPAPGSVRVGPSEQVTAVADVVDVGGRAKAGVTVWFNVTHVPTGQRTVSVQTTTNATGHLEVTLPYDLPAASGLGANLPGEHRVTVEARAPNLLDLGADPGAFETASTAWTYEVAPTG